jgi:hypothetical protein
MTSLDAHEWAIRKLEGAIDEYVKGVWPKATYQWVLGELYFALEKMNITKPEVEAILAKHDKPSLQHSEHLRLNELKEAIKSLSPSPDSYPDRAQRKA